MKKKSIVAPVLILLLPFFDPSFLTQDGMPEWIDYVIKGFQIFAIFISAFFVPSVLNHPKARVSHGILTLFLFVYLVIITIINNGSIFYSLSCLFQLFAVFTISSYFVFCKDGLEQLLSVLSIYLTILVLLDIVSLLFSTQEWWVFGGKNNHIHFTLLYLFVSIAKCGIKKTVQLKDIFVPIILSTTIIFLENSSTSIIALGLNLFFIIFYALRPEKSLSKARNSILIIYGISLVVSIILIMFEQYRYLELVIAYYDKEDTFGRIGIWEQAVEYIRINPIWGYGLEELEVIGEKFQFEFTQCHNKFVDVLYLGGVVGLSFFLFVLYYTFRKTKKNKTQLILSFVLSVYAIVFITEGKRMNIPFYFMLFMYPIVSNYIEEKRLSV